MTKNKINNEILTNKILFMTYEYIYLDKKKLVLISIRIPHY